VYVVPERGTGPQPGSTYALQWADGTLRVGTTDRRGAVLDPSVVTATAPEFGEAALAAIRQWRFLPKVKAGRPLETRATMPFDFCPPEKD